MMATFTEAALQIQRLKGLPIGWDYGRDGPANDNSCANALLITQLLHSMGVTQFDILPGTDGSVIAIGYRGEESVEIEALSNGTFNFVHESAAGDGEPLIGITISDIANRLEDCGWQSARLYVSCTRGAMWRASSDMPPFPLGAPPMVAAYQLYAPIVWPRPDAEYASTFGNSTIQKSRGSRQYSGEYREINFQKVPA